MGKRILKIDALTLPDHYYLDDTDECYYSGEYTAGENHAYSDTNQLIHNFKKTMDKKGTPQWQYKQQAILNAAKIIRDNIKVNANLTFIPVPPSKAKFDPLYDDRIIQMLVNAFKGSQADIREIIIQSNSSVASHTKTVRPTPEELQNNYEIDKSLISPPPQTIIIVDDVITTGCHYKAVKNMLTQIYPNTTICGLFLARRVPKSVDFDFDMDI